MRLKKWILVILCFSLCFSRTVRAEEMIAIETEKTYEGMGDSFAKGYEPVIKRNTLFLVIPFVTEAKLSENSIMVGISFEREENSPFYYKNYQKKVKKSKDGTYLYKCGIKLKKNRVNGQYPLHISVQARAGEEILRQDFTIYLEITDGQTAVQTEKPKDNGAGNDAMGQEDDVLKEQEPVPQEQGEVSLQIGMDQTGEAAPAVEEVRHQPRVLLMENSLQGESLQAGSSVSWHLVAQNCSSRQQIENMRVTLLSDNKNITFEKTSWYFAQTGADRQVDLSQQVTVGKKALAEPIAVQFQFEYEDKDGNSYTTTETVSLSVSQPLQAELVNLSFPESIYESDREPLMFQVLNTGLSSLYNVRVRLEGRGLFPEKELFFGNMEAGTSLDGEIQVFAGTLNMGENGEITEEQGEKYGDTLAKVIFSYENEQGETLEQSQEFVTAIKKPQILELKVDTTEQKTNQWWITVVFFVILALVLIIIWLYLRMKYYQNRKVEH